MSPQSSAFVCRPPVEVIGLGWEIPSFERRASLGETLAGPSLAEPVFEPERQLGKKGLRYKERATVMAMCAARGALMDAGLLDEAMTPLNAHDFGVVVASNSGNLDTVCRAADIIHREHVDATSPMDLPNASSNIVASALAIRFGLKALNLMVCSGASASLDALILAANAIRQGRAARMLVVTVETDGAALRSLLAGRRLDDAMNGEAPILEGAGAVILASSGAARAQGARVRASLSDHAFAHAHAPSQDAIYALFDAHPAKRRYVPAQNFIEQQAGTDGVAAALASTMLKGYGSAALLQLIHASEQQAGEGAVIVGGGTWMDRRAGAIVVNKARPAGNEVARP